MSNTEALAKNFGVSPAIVNNILDTGPDREDLAVGSNGLTSGRDRTTEFAVAPRDASQWIEVSINRNSPASPNTLSIGRPNYTSPTVSVWLPKDREMTTHIVDTYFTHLNLHRPVFGRMEFAKILNEYYDGTAAAYDPGHICSVYLILALGTLSDLNHRAVRAELENKGEVIEHLGPEMAKKLMPASWPQHDEFFERALAVKPDLRVTISSLQALILLHWYLYTEVSCRHLYFGYHSRSYSAKEGRFGASLAASSACRLSWVFIMTRRRSSPPTTALLTRTYSQRKNASCEFGFGVSFSSTTEERPSFSDDRSPSRLPIPTLLALYAR